MKKSIWLFIGVYIVFFLAGCTAEKQENKNMEQIYSEEGVPVKVVNIAPKKFVKTLPFNAELSGIKESSEYASFDGKIEKVYVNVGDYVKKGTVLISLPEDNPSAQFRQAKAAFENAQKAFKRVQNIFASGGISKQDKDNVKTQYQVAKANWETVKQMVKIKAPIDGYVTKINVRPTDNIKREIELFTISQTNKLKCKIWVSDNEVLQVKVGQKANAAWNGLQIFGKVVQVDMAINKKSQAFGVMLEFDNQDNLFKLGVTADIFIDIYENEKTFIVKQKDLINEKSKTFVFLAKDGHAKKQEITTGLRNGIDIEILSGLFNNDILIVEGQMLLADGSKVKIIK